MQEEMVETSTFSQRLRKAMDAAGEYPAVLAKAIGISHVAAQSYSAGQVPRADLLIRIARHYQVTTDYLLGISNESGLHPVNPLQRGAIDPDLVADRDRWQLRALEAEARAAQLELELARARSLLARPGQAPAAAPRVSSGFADASRKGDGTAAPGTPAPGESGSGSTALKNQKIVAGGMRGVDPEVEQAALLGISLAEKKLRADEQAARTRAGRTSKTSGGPTGPSNHPGSKSAGTSSQKS